MAFNLFIFPGKELLKNNAEVYLNTYDTFKIVWEETFQQVIAPNYQMFSNEFTRQDRIQSLFDGDRCVGLTCIRNINLSNPLDLEDSWFKCWDPAHFETLRKQNGSDASINSFFTINPEFRKTFVLDTIHPSYILGCLSILDQIHVQKKLMLGMMRTDRSMQNLGKSWGSELIETKVLHNNIPTDLVAFRERDLQKISQKYPKIVWDIWNKRTDYTKEGTRDQQPRVA